MIPRLIVPGQQDKKIMRINDKIAFLGNRFRFRYSELFPPEVISDMGVNPNEYVTLTANRSRYHLRWMNVGWPTVIEIASLTSHGTVGWRIVGGFWNAGCNVNNCWDSEHCELVGTIPQPFVSGAVSNIYGMDANEACNRFTIGNYQGIPDMSTDLTTHDNLYNNALYFNDIPIFRTWHPTHEDRGAKYSTDSRAFKNIDLDNDNNKWTYELQMNDAKSYGESSYDDAAIVFYNLR